MSFNLHSDFIPAGDQPQAIAALTEGVLQGETSQILLGATGTGKTFSIAHVIQNVDKPTLVLVHNKTLAAQLYAELKGLFPKNAVEYFVSYYDYYQPEAYVPSTDNYIAKDSSINEKIDKLRHAATRSLLQRRDVIIVSSVSCIYGLGSKEAYDGMVLTLEESQVISRAQIIAKLVDLFYTRNDVDFHRGTFRVRGDIIDIFPAHEDQRAIRVEMFDDEVERLSYIDPLRGTRISFADKIAVFPASHYVTPKEELERAIAAIKIELTERLAQLQEVDKLVEHQRLKERTLYDIEMLEETGGCSGIENYSRHLSNRKSGEAPPTLLEYFPSDWLLVVDESHVTIPQVRAMYKGDRSRKKTLVEFGFRLPSALDNRPLQFQEFLEMINQVIFVSATPSMFEIERSNSVIVEQIIRPTGLLDPTIEVRSFENQVDDLYTEILSRVENKERVLVTTLTKRMSQDLANYYDELGVKVQYLHSDIDTLERVEIIRDLRKGVFDVLVGINLLREGLDIPEVSLVAILDADKQGFLRNRTSLIQTIGRAARNSNGHVLLYAQRVTPAMREAIEETERRRAIQNRYNQKHGIKPRTIEKDISSPLEQFFVTPTEKTSVQRKDWEPSEIPKLVSRKRKEMLQEATQLNFERAAELRDEIQELEMFLLTFT
jgi:excinuclease ABC subunit B